MDKIIAVRVSEVGADLMVEGFVSRGRNRKCVWRVFSSDGDRQKLRADCLAEEAKREAGEPTSLALLQRRAS